MSAHFMRKAIMNLVMMAMVLVSFVGIMRTSPVHSTAHAASPTITLNPSSQPYRVHFKIRVKGQGYLASENVSIYWNYQGLGTGTFETEVVVATDGSFTATFHMPLAPYGTYPIAAIGQTSGIVSVSSFQELPNLLVTPKAGGVGSKIALSGSAFSAGEVVNLYWEYAGPGTGILIGTATSDATGSFTTHAHIPSSTSYGMVPIVGVGLSSKTTAQALFVFYAPTLALAPLSGSAGTTLTISAYGFAGKEPVQVFWNNGSTPVLTAHVNTLGYLAPTTMLIPEGTAPGSYAVTLVGSTSNTSVNDTFTVVAPGSLLNVTSGPVGTNVSVAGQGYAPGETVNVLWNATGPGQGTLVATGIAGSSGVISTEFAVPAAGNGAYPVAIVGVTSNYVTQNTYTISNGLSLVPAIDAPGQESTVNGTGFQANEQVQLTWDSTPLSAMTADASGNISGVVTIPANATPGTHLLVGSGQSSGTTFTVSATIDTGWSSFGFTNADNRSNSFENSLGQANVANLQRKWSANIGSQPEGAPSPIYFHGLVYIATLSGYLNAYNATNGTLVWQFNSATGYANLSSPVLDPATNTIFFGTLGYLQPQDTGVASPFYALDASTGVLKWSVIIPGDDYGFPTLAFNTIYVGVANEGTGSLLAIDETTGNLDWQYQANGGVWGAVGVDQQTNTIFTGVGNPGDEVLAFNAVSGTLLWQYKVPPYGFDDDIGAAIAVANGMLYVDSKNGNMYALNENTGMPVWSTQIGLHSIGNVSSPAISPNGTLYVGSLDGNVYALNATTGAIIWKTHTAHAIFSSPAVANGVVYVASNNHKFYALNTTTGAVLWTYTTSGPTFSSPIVANGWLYCASTDGNLYAFSL